MSNSVSHSTPFQTMTVLWFTTTCYYKKVSLDSFGLQREPKWSHLRDGHKVVNQCKKALLNGEPTT